MEPSYWIIVVALCVVFVGFTVLVFENICCLEFRAQKISYSGMTTTTDDARDPNSGEGQEGGDLLYPKSLVCKSAHKIINTYSTVQYYCTVL
jgi:hypothetical protein